MRCSLASSRRASLTAALGLALVLPSLCSSSSLHAADQKLGKVFIKATSANVDGQQFADQAMEDTVKDLKRRADKFVVVDSEKDADYLITVIERFRNPTRVEVKATISYKENGQWKPGTRLTGAANSWTVAAVRVLKQAEDWVTTQRGK